MTRQRSLDQIITGAMIIRERRVHVHVYYRFMNYHVITGAVNREGVQELANDYRQRSLGKKSQGQLLVRRPMYFTINSLSLSSI